MIERETEFKYFMQAAAIVGVVAAIMYCLVTLMHEAQGFPSIAPIPREVQERYSIYVRMKDDHEVYRTLTYNGATWRSQAECELALHSTLMQSLLADAQSIAKDRYGAEAEAIGFCAMEM